MAWRVADSLSLRSFLDLELTEASPDHSTLSRTRRRIDVETHEAVFTWVLERLSAAGLVGGKTVGIDATTLEANAAMRSIERRDTGESHEAFIRRLAEASGVETPDAGGSGSVRPVSEEQEDVEQGLEIAAGPGTGGMRRVWVRGHENVRKLSLGRRRHVAGFRCYQRLARRARRFIPARAGWTPKNPASKRPFRVHPARAGDFAAPSAIAEITSVHPRVCGVDDHCFVARRTFIGSSPRLRGRFHNRAVAGVLAGLIPPGAGGLTPAPAPAPARALVGFLPPLQLCRRPGGEQAVRPFPSTRGRFRLVERSGRGS